MKREIPQDQPYSIHREPDITLIAPGAFKVTTDKEHSNTHHKIEAESGVRAEQAQEGRTEGHHPRGCLVVRVEVSLELLYPPLYSGLS